MSTPLTFPSGAVQQSVMTGRSGSHSSQPSATSTDAEGETSAAARRERLVGMVQEMGPRIAARAVRSDREAAFPTENFAEFRDNGLLALCVPEAHGGLGASYADYVRVSEEIGRYCGATALTFNMHNATMLWCGRVADLLGLSSENRERHEAVRAQMFRGVVERGEIHSQPFSEGTAPGETAGVGTAARVVDGGFRVTGRKIFASLSGNADFYNVTAQVVGEEQIRLLGVPARGDGVTVLDDWDPLGMRGTVSRTLLLDDVFVPASNEWMPVGAYNEAANRYPWLFLSLCPSYLGLTRGILDFTAAYLRGEVPGQRGGARRDHVVKQLGWAQMQVKYEQSRALLHGVIDSARIDPEESELVTGWAAAATVMEHAAEVASIAVRVCGGQSMFRSLPLERMYRDARLGALMLPWSAEVCLERLGRARLYEQA
jgi:alkylation response protein AidB-like acyl-CoA dehydrogenase